MFSREMLQLPQWRRLLAAFIQVGERGLFVYEMTGSRPESLGISQYNSRIKDLRKKGWNVVCVRAGFFVMRGRSESVQEPVYTVEQYKKLKDDLLEVYYMTSGSHKQKILKEGIAMNQTLEIMEALL